MLENPEVQRLVARFRRVDYSYQIPYVAGSSQDGSVVYIDSALPHILSGEVDGKKFAFEPKRFLIIHETFENAFVTAFNWRYEEAHKWATAIERREVVTSGRQWAAYQRAYEPYVRADEHEKLTKVPPDLALYPYRDDDPKLYRHLKKMMEKESGGKVSKSEAKYNASGGSASKHCGPDHRWPRGNCSMFERPDGCSKVSGFIEPRGVCRFWAPAKEKN